MCYNNRVDSMKCKICGIEAVTEDDPICPSCKAILLNQNLGLDGFKI